MKRYVQAGKFKAQCLKLMDEVNLRKYCLIITKRNKPIAKMVPIKENHPKLFGKLKGTAHIKGDIIQPIKEEWDACL